MKTVSVITKDSFLFNKIRLALIGEAEVIPNRDRNSALTLVDLDTETANTGEEFISMSRSFQGADLKIPFSLSAVSHLLMGGESSAILTLSEETKTAYLRGEKIKLTEIETRLLSKLIEKGGEFCPREELHLAAWDEETDIGVLNVYIHYLRSKLEFRGEKIIISSRKNGYKIDEKYLSLEVGYAENN